jgi:hypothetical protein
VCWRQLFETDSKERSQLLQIGALILIVLVLAADLIYSGFANKKGELVAWRDLILVAFIIFVIFIDQIYKLTIGMKGIVFEQQKQRFSAVARLQTAEGSQKLAELDAVLQDFSGKGKDIWSRMIIYRISLRALLRRVCSEKISEKTFKLQDTTPMDKMIETLQSENVITKEFADQLDEIRRWHLFLRVGNWGSAIGRGDYQNRKRCSEASQKAGQDRII